MRWFLLIVVIGLILSLGNWSYHQMDHAVLITDSWKSTEGLEWGLVDFRGEKAQLYGFESHKEFWPIFKGLWPVWTLFILLFLVLTPLSILIYHWQNNEQIVAAKCRQTEAELAQTKAEDRANKKIMEAESKAENQVSSAYKEQKKRVRAELDSETQSLHQLKNNLLQRETAINKKDIAAQRAQEQADQKVSEIQRLYAEELQRFDTEIAGLTKARDNAQAGYQRLKNKNKR